eukprot:1239867-Rhodomonas_salina.1
MPPALSKEGEKGFGMGRGKFDIERRKDDDLSEKSKTKRTREKTTTSVYTSCELYSNCNPPINIHGGTCCPARRAKRCSQSCPPASAGKKINNIVQQLNACCRSNPTGGGHGANRHRTRRRWR